MQLKEAFILGWIAGTVMSYKHNKRGYDIYEALKRFDKDQNKTNKNTLNLLDFIKDINE